MVSIFISETSEASRHITMDPITQGLIGATLPQVVARDRRMLLWAGCFGFLARAAAGSGRPDYARRRTHCCFLNSTGNSPIRCCSSPLADWFARLFSTWFWGDEKAFSFKTTWLFCTLGYGSHGLLDAFTSYGTMLLWPFSSARISLSFVSVIDPLFTLPVMALVIPCRHAAKSGGLRWQRCSGPVFILVRECFRETRLWKWAKPSPHHADTRQCGLDAKPSFANILIWKTIYESDGQFFVDAVRATFVPRVFFGASVQKLNNRAGFSRSRSKLPAETGYLLGFDWFSDGFLAQDPFNPDRIVDVRYSMVPNEIDALWSIGVSASAGPDTHVTFQTHRREPRDSLGRLWSMMIAPEE